MKISINEENNKFMKTASFSYNNSEEFIKIKLL